MNRDFLQLIKKFEEIKNAGYHKSVRKGKYGIGDTFEFLIGKEFDQDYYPDYENIEIKAKLGYSKTPLTLFSLTPKSSHDYTIKYLVDTFGYPESSFSKFNALRAEARNNSNYLVAKNYYFNTVVNWEEKRVELIIKNKKGEILSSEIYWEFEELEKRLTTKLKYMALVIGYPYYINHIYYYKYFKMGIYELKSFSAFLKLIESGDIAIVFNIGIYKDDEHYGNIYDHGTSFKIKTEDIYKLFVKLY